jgi:hypothetical protein
LLCILQVLKICCHFPGITENTWKCFTLRATLAKVADRGALSHLSGHVGQGARQAMAMPAGTHSSPARAARRCQAGVRKEGEKPGCSPGARRRGRLGRGKRPAASNLGGGELGHPRGNGDGVGYSGRFRSIAQAGRKRTGRRSSSARRRGRGRRGAAALGDGHGGELGR